MKQTCILILGMHRSGTSALSGTLNILDVYLGSELMKPKEQNAKGFYENMLLYRLNEKLLKAMGSSWDDVFYNEKKLEEIQDISELELVLKQEFQYSQIFAIKDPRLAYLFPLYTRALTNLGVDVKVIIPFRNPIEVANSLSARNKFSQEKGLLLWAYNFLLSEWQSRNFPRVITSFDELVKAPESVIKVIDQGLDLNLIAKYEEKKEQVLEFLTPNLKHHNISLDNLSGNVAQVIREIVSYVGRSNEIDFSEVLDSLRKQIFGSQALFYHAEVLSDLRALVETKQKLLTRNTELEESTQKMAVKKQELELARSELMTQRKELNQTRQQVEAVQILLEQQQQEKNQLLKQVDSLRQDHLDMANSLQRELAGRDRKIREFQNAIYQSTSWKITSPLRKAGLIVVRAKGLKDFLSSLVVRGGGVRGLLHKTKRIYHEEGFRGVHARLIAHGSARRLLTARVHSVGITIKTTKLIGKAEADLQEGKASSSNLTLFPKVVVAEDNFKQTDLGLKVVVVVHVSHLDVLSSLFFRILNIEINYDLIMTVASGERVELERLLAEQGLTATILEVEECGYDILPFIKCLPFILDGGYDLVCKLHAKKGLFNLEKHCPDVGGISLDMLLDPIIGSPEAVRQCLYSFADNSKLGMLGSADFYKSSRHLMDDNDVDVSRLVLKLNSNFDPAKSWGFFAGAVFWCRPEMFKPLLELLPELEKTPVNHANTEGAGSIWHALERIMGLLPQLSGQKTALAYSSDLQSNRVRVMMTQGSPIESGSPYRVEGNIAGMLSLSNDWHYLQDAPEFCREFYVRTYPHIQEMDIDPLFHYLRYGVYEGCNPNPNFSSAWYWDEHGDVALVNPLVHYLKYGSEEGRCSFPAIENQDAIMELVESTGFFDHKYYLANNPDVLASKIYPLEHFSKYGWRELRQPGSASNFDLIWYMSQYLTEWRNPINPLLHFAVCHNKRNLLPRPLVDNLPLTTGHVFPEKHNVRRICLFAGYDPHGLVDDYVVHFVEELARYCEIYYLADCELQPGELEKLSKMTKGAWAFRHGEYDFGSYSRLARDLVGWEQIREYDELLLVNDSSYLLSNLKPVFDKMNDMACDWWGLQATKGISATRNISRNTFKQKIDMQTVLDRQLPSYEKDECYDFHIGSYFLAFRQPVLQVDGVLQRLLNSVRKERTKKNIILRYEIGLTRQLLLAGHRPATFIDHLYPFHPIYTKYHFDLIREGFPLLKRFLLTENHYHIPELWRWSEWVKDILPGVDLSSAERNLTRIGDADKLYASLNIPIGGGAWPNPLMNNAQFQKEDAKTPKDDYCWAFPVCGFDHLFSGNERLLFESVKDNPKIHKVILTRSKSVQLDGVNIDVVPLKSLEGQKLLIKARYIFIKHSPTRNAQYPLDTEQHRFINLWHGIPLKRIGYASLDQLSQLDAISAEHARCHAVISSSKVDRLAMAAAFYPLSYHNVWVTGLPRNDMILRDENSLPADFQDQLGRLRQALAGRRLVLFAPTFRNAQAQGYYPFSEAERQALADCLNAHGAVLGIREHMADKAHSYSESLGGMDMPVISLDRLYYADIELLYREAELLITDYSSCFIDYMLTGKPEICFAYDYESYAGSERGLFYDLNDVFPGPICFDFPALLESLQKVLGGQRLETESSYKFKQKLFFDYVDDRNTQRLIEHIESEIGVIAQ